MSTVITSWSARTSTCATPDELWRVLLAGKQPELLEAVGSPFIIPTPSKYEFDTLPFGVLPVDARWWSPARRLLLECAWEAIERSSLRMVEDLAGKDYGCVLACYDYDYRPFGDQGWASPASWAFGDIPFCFGITGFCMNVESNCSSSAMCLMLASDSILSNRISGAFVGAAQLFCHQYASLPAVSPMLSKTGRCRTFDNAADGYVQAEGCGVLILQPRVALASSWAIEVLGLHAQNGGRTPARGWARAESMTPLWTALVERKLLEAQHCAVLEAHGTGIKSADCDEVLAACQVYGHCRRQGNSKPLIMQSITTVLGYHEVARGMFGFVKWALSFAHSQLPCHANFNHLSALVGSDLLESARVCIPLESVSMDWGDYWVAENHLSYGGTHAHTIFRHLRDFGVMREKEALPLFMSLSAPRLATLKKFVGLNIDTLRFSQAPLTHYCKAVTFVRKHFAWVACATGLSCKDLVHDMEKSTGTLLMYTQKKMQSCAVACAGKILRGNHGESVMFGFLQQMGVVIHKVILWGKAALAVLHHVMPECPSSLHREIQVQLQASAISVFITCAGSADLVPLSPQSLDAMLCAGRQQVLVLRNGDCSSLETFFKGSSFDIIFPNPDLPAFLDQHHAQLALNLGSSYFVRGLLRKVPVLDVRSPCHVARSLAVASCLLVCKAHIMPCGDAPTLPFERKRYSN